MSIFYTFLNNHLNASKLNIFYHNETPKVTNNLKLRRRHSNFYLFSATYFVNNERDFILPLSDFLIYFNYSSLPPFQTLTRVIFLKI